MRRFSAILFIGILMTALTACGGNGNQAEENPGAVLIRVGRKFPATLPFSGGAAVRSSSPGRKQLKFSRNSIQK